MILLSCNHIVKLPVRISRAFSAWQLRCAWIDILRFCFFCFRIFAIGANGTPPIQETIIFTHSMGSLVFAAALRAGICSMDVTTSTWYTISGPIAGTLAADAVEAMCLSSDRLEEPLRLLAAKWHYCASPQPGPANVAYLAMRPSDPSFVGLAQVVAKYANVSDLKESTLCIPYVYRLEL